MHDVLTALCLMLEKNKFYSNIQVSENAPCRAFCNNVTEELAILIPTVSNTN